jgi:hypothetical protein
VPREIRRRLDGDDASGWIRRFGHERSLDDTR